MDSPYRARASAGTLPLSIEATLDEENRQVLARMNRSRSKSPNPRGVRGRTPPPVRSMLDVDAPIPRHGSAPGIGMNIPPSARDLRKPSTRLDPSDPSTWTSSAKVPLTPPKTTGRGETIGIGASQGLPTIQIDSKDHVEHNDDFDIASGGAAGSPQGKRTRDASNGSRSDVDEQPGLEDTKSSPVSKRSSSPTTKMLSTESLQRKPRKSSGGSEDQTKRRLSNKSSSFSTVTDDSEDVRVLEDAETDENAVAESSSEEDQRATDGDDDDEESPVTDRGRQRDKPTHIDLPAKDEVAMSDRKDAPQSKGVKSMIDPLLSPSLPHKKTHDIHPDTSFGRSGPTAADFANEDDIDKDIEKAKSLGTSISPLDDSVHDRHVRMIIRGDWKKFQDDSENNNNSSPRLYLACTDLSTEASYSVEWTVGTMLRDGDTLLAIYAIEDENAPKEPEGNTQVLNESAKAAQDASDAMESLTRRTTNLESVPGIKFVPAIDAPTAAGSMDLSQLSRKEIERIKAIDEITANFLKLVRKTPLQVRCMIEVIHCKSPKHLILNAIDELEPTLCVVGTRGRNSLKGVLLGSFSNYLVMKSSVPVMVARKRLKKPGAGKLSSTSVKMTNNLTNSLMPKKRRSLREARID